MLLIYGFIIKKILYYLWININKNQQYCNTANLPGVVVIVKVNPDA